MKKLFSLLLGLIFISQIYAANASYKWTAEVSPTGKATIKYGSSTNFYSTYSSEQTGNGLLTRYFKYENLDSGYDFVRWELWEEGSSSAKSTSTNESCSFQLSNNTNRKTVKLILQEKSKYTITAASGENGSATVNGESSVTVYEGTNVTLVASPDPGYELYYWSDNNSIKDLSRTVSATSTRTYTAYFKKSETQYTINVGVATGCTGMGTVKTDNNTTSKTVNSGSDVTITATSTDYVFKGWSTDISGSPIVSRSASYVANVTSNITYYAVFTAPKECSVSTSSSTEAVNWVTPPDIEGAVDLGLPSGLLWRNRNVGAQTASNYGSYFAWGETVAMTSVPEANTYGFKDSQYDDYSTLPAAYDAASVNLEDGWRMPTREEFQELITKATWTLGTDRWYVSGNNNSIFFPYCGHISSQYPANSYSFGRYWTSSKFAGTGTAKQPYYLDIDDTKHTITYNNNFQTNSNCYHGYSIRPVHDGASVKMLTINVQVGNSVVATKTYRCEEGEKVSVTVAAAANYTSEWSDAVSTSSARMFQMDQNRTATVVYTSTIVNHTVSYFLDKNDANATASVQIQDGNNLTFPSNIQTLLQTRFGDKVYSNLVWKNKSGDATVTTSTTVTADMNCYVEFDTSVDLTLGAFTGGTVTLDAGGDPIVATEGGVHNFAENTAVILTAIPAQGYHFVKWYENNDTKVEYRILSLSENTTLTPVFAETPSITIYDTWTEGQWKNTETNDINAKRGQQLDATLARSFSTGAWATLSLPFAYNMTSDDALYNSVYKFRRVILSQDGGSVYIDFIRSNDINANEPYLVVPRQDVTNPVFNNVTLVAADEMEAVPLNGTGVDFVSSPWQQTITGNRYFYVGANSNLYYAKNAGTTIKGNRAYFHKADGAPAPRRVTIVLDGEEKEVEIAEDGSMEEVQSVRKYMEDGVLIIECNGIRMDAQGNRIK